MQASLILSFWKSIKERFYYYGQLDNLITNYYYQLSIFVFIQLDSLLKVVFFVLAQSVLYENSTKKKNHCIEQLFNIMITKINVRWMFWLSWCCFFFQYHDVKHVGWVNKSLDPLGCWTYCNKLQKMIRLQKIKFIWDQVLFIIPWPKQEISQKGLCC